MATLAVTHPTLADWAKRVDPDGSIAAIVELLSQSNDILTDMVWVEGNLPTGHQTTVRTGLPTVYWRLLNAGVQPSKSTTAQVTEGIGMLESWSEVDVDLAKLNANLEAFRASEARPFLSAMAQEFAQTVWYGNSTTAPEEFHGLSQRFSDTTAANGQNIIDAGGTGSDNSSVWLIVWSEQTAHGIFPKGSQAGLMHEDLGIETNEATGGTAGARSRVYRDHFQWKGGISVRDWRNVVRIANIDISDLTDNSGSQAELAQNMAKAIHRIDNLSAGRAAFYMNRTCFQQLDIQRLDDVKAGALTYESVDGKIIPSFRGIPIRRADQLLETEAQVT